uniref:ubiquitinyl hydrolase 1 n=1 Tax=Plectus sambesii TaxID=2011161 RepID=A0A914XHD0_9BILA
FPLTNEFPYPNAPIFPYDGLAEALVSPMSGDAQSLASEYVPQSPSHTPTGDKEPLDDELAVNDRAQGKQAAMGAPMYQHQTYAEHQQQQQQQQQQHQQQQQQLYDQATRQKELSPGANELARNDFMQANVVGRLPPPGPHNFSRMPPHGMSHMGYSIPHTMSIPGSNQPPSPYGVPAPAAPYPTAYLQQQQFQPAGRSPFVVYQPMMQMYYPPIYQQPMPPFYRQRLLLSQQQQQQLYSQQQMAQPPPTMQQQHSMQQSMYNHQQYMPVVVDDQREQNELVDGEEGEDCGDDGEVYECDSSSQPPMMARTMPAGESSTPQQSQSPVDIEYVEEDEQRVADPDDVDDSDCAPPPHSVEELTFGNFDDAEPRSAATTTGGDRIMTGSASDRHRGPEFVDEGEQRGAPQPRAVDQASSTGMQGSAERADLHAEGVRGEEEKHEPERSTNAPLDDGKAAISTDSESAPATTAQASPPAAAGDDDDESAATTESSSATASAAPATKSWASLFKRDRYEAIVVNSDQRLSTERAEDWPTPGVSADVQRPSHASTSSYKKAVVAPHQDAEAEALKAMLKTLSIVHKGPTFQPRGLFNSGNWCYANSVLQALVACPPFFHLMRHFGHAADRVNTSTPILDALSLFVAEFAIDQNKQRRSRLEYDMPMTASNVQEMVARLKSDAAYKGRQEDAEELLLALLNGLHEEMIALMEMDSPRGPSNSDPHLTNGHASDDSQPAQPETDEWQQVLPGKKHPITRQTVTTETPLSQIFMGHVRYSIHRQGAKDSANIEQFFTLPLEIQSHEVNDVVSALSHSLRKETFKGSATTSSSSGAKVTKEVSTEVVGGKG